MCNVISRVCVVGASFFLCPIAFRMTLQCVYNIVKISIAWDSYESVLLVLYLTSIFSLFPLQVEQYHRGQNKKKKRIVNALNDLIWDASGNRANMALANKILMKKLDS